MLFVHEPGIAAHHEDIGHDRVKKTQARTITSLAFPFCTARFSIGKRLFGGHGRLPEPPQAMGKTWVDFGGA